MKKIFTLLFVSVFALSSCTSDDGLEGPPGPQGPQGPPGVDGYGTVVDFVGVDLNESTGYEFYFEFNEPDIDIEVFESDAVLVYLKTGEDGEADGAPVEVFRMLPQTYYIDGEALQYNYDFTFFDVSIFLDGTIDLSTLDDDYTEDLVFRVVVLPAEFASTINTSNMDAVLRAMDVQSTDIKKSRF